MHFPTNPINFEVFKTKKEFEQSVIFG